LGSCWPIISFHTSFSSTIVLLFVLGYYSFDHCIFFIYVYDCLHILIIFLHVDLDRTRWRLFQKRVACTKLDIYFLFITMSGSIPLLVGYIYYYERLDTSAGGDHCSSFCPRLLFLWSLYFLYICIWIRLNKRKQTFKPYN
jgi:hypothetical protein